MVNLKVDTDSIAGAKAMLALVGRSVDPIIYRSINKSIDNTQTKAVDKIYAVLNLTKTRAPCIEQENKSDKSLFKKIVRPTVGDRSTCRVRGLQPN